MQYFKTLLSVALVACTAFALSITVSAHGGHHRSTTYATPSHTACGQSCFTDCTQTGANHVHTADCGTHTQSCPYWADACTQDCYTACTQTGANHVHTADCGIHADYCPHYQASASSSATQRPAVLRPACGQNHRYGHHA